MNASSETTLQILLRKEEESQSAFVRRIRAAKGNVLVVPGSHEQHFLSTAEERTAFIGELADQKDRVALACRDAELCRMARAEGITVFDRVRSLKTVLVGQPQAQEVIRVFHPSAWKQQWRSKLQSMGLLSLPRVRIIVLLALSSGLFFFVLFYLLPSAEVRVWPKSDSESQTANVMLALSGAVNVPETRLRNAPLIPFTVNIEKTTQFTNISKEYVGSNAVLQVKITNNAKEPYKFKKGTRIVNEAGMVFRIQLSVYLDPGQSETVKALAENTDIYGEEIGKRGNVPAGLAWTMPGLTNEERPLIKIVNTVEGKGGHSATRTVVKQEDLDKAAAQLKAELLVLAKKQVEENRQLANATDSHIELLTKNDVIKMTYTGFVIPTNLLGQAVPSIPITGRLVYTMYGYDAQKILELLSSDAVSRVMEGKQIVQSTFRPDRLRVYIIDYAEDLSWIKVTADLTTAEEYVLDPLSPTGVQFGRKVREAVTGLPLKDALRILRNLPEVQKAEVKIWPPWSGHLPAIPAHIYIVPQ